MDKKLEPEFFEDTQQLLVRAELKGHPTPLIENVRSGIGDFSRIYSNQSSYLHAQNGNTPDFVFLYDGNSYERQLGVQALRTLGRIGYEAFETGTSPLVDSLDLISAQRVFRPFCPLWAGMEHTQVFPFVVQTSGKKQKLASAFNMINGVRPSFQESYLLADKHIIDVVRRHGNPKRIDRYRNGIYTIATHCVANIPWLKDTIVSHHSVMSLVLHCDGIYLIDRNDKHFPLFLREDIYEKIKEELYRFNIIWYKSFGEVWAYEPKDISQDLLSEQSSHLSYKSCCEDFSNYRDLYINRFHMD